jgi:hypothetical protein
MATTFTLVQEVDFRGGTVHHWLVPDDRVTPGLAAVLAAAVDDVVGGMRPPVLELFRAEMGELEEFHGSLERRQGVLWTRESRECVLPAGAVITRFCMTFRDR